MKLPTSFLALAASTMLTAVGCSTPSGVVDSGTHDAGADVANDHTSSDVAVRDTAGGDDVAADTAPEAAVDAGGGDVATLDVPGDSPAPIDAAGDAVADAPARDTAVADVAIPDGGCANCIASPLAWGNTGGFIAFSDGSELDACNVFVARRMTAGGTTTAMCTDLVPTCASASSVDMAQVLTALAVPEVQAALAANATYGRIIPDGGTFRITYAGGSVSIQAGACTGTSGCVSPPASVAHLRSVLQQLTSQQIAIEPCATTFPGGGF